MQNIFDALPDAASQLSDIITLTFTSGIAWLIVPFVFVELVILVFHVVRGRRDNK